MRSRAEWVNYANVVPTIAVSWPVNRTRAIGGSDKVKLIIIIMGDSYIAHIPSNKMLVALF